MVCEKLRHTANLDLIDLNDYNIHPYDYDHPNLNDDFIPLIEKTLEYDLIIFATPVYWYSTSTQLKKFIDRFSDLVRVRKDLGSTFQGKTLGAISCSSEARVLPYFEGPFMDTANYMKMRYAGYLHTYCLQDLVIPDELAEQIESFGQKLKKFLTNDD